MLRVKIILIHGESVIKHFAVLPIGQLSEDALESRNKDYEKFRLHHARKCSKSATNEDVFHTLLYTSDPYITSIRKPYTKNVKELVEDTLDLLKVNELALLARLLRRGTQLTLRMRSLRLRTVLALLARLLRRRTELALLARLLPRRTDLSLIARLLRRRTELALVSRLLRRRTEPTLRMRSLRLRTVLALLARLLRLRTELTLRMRSLRLRTVLALLALLLRNCTMENRRTTAD